VKRTPRALIGAALVIAGIAWANYVVTHRWDILAAVDLHAYWSSWQGGALYEPGARLAEATYIYSPAFAIALWPLTLLPFETFHLIWIAGSILAVAWLVWPIGGWLRWIAFAFFGWLALEARADVLIALSIAVSLRYPVAWAIPFLTKVTPAIGLLWFAMREDWGHVRTALLGTALIIAVTFIALPRAWLEWAEVLQRSVPLSAHGDLFGVSIPSLLVRLPLAAAIVFIGARRGWSWVVPVAAVTAAPDIWVPTLVILAAIPRLPMEQPGETRPIHDQSASASGEHDPRVSDVIA
jgi:hypothetical protein